MLIAKRSAYCFSNNACDFVHNYLSTRQQKVTIGHLFSSWMYLAKGVHQGSILRPQLFNIFCNHIYFFVEVADLLNDADDNTILYTVKDLKYIYDTLSNIKLQIKNTSPRLFLSLRKLPDY